MRFSLSIPVLSLGVLGSAVSGSALSKRDLCGQWDSVSAGAYTIYQNLWGEASATSGWQCTGLDYQGGNVISWHTSWNWQGAPSSVKSYANAGYTFGARQLSSISSIPTVWKWSYTGSNIVADVAYDIFTSYSPGGSAAFEIMIWLAAIGGAGPISSTGSPIATVTIAGTAWNLFKGPNGATTVFSFVAHSEQTSFNADILDFFKYLIQSQGLPSSLYVSGIAAGTEPFLGSNAQLTTGEYVITVN
ncbi:hypothetical protein Asppvi_001976 [Aspergillus pseudoviridinutans]|uniref:xyloglucan-specific endo-beta-1,4-glucanase n=1 Tax=Aspergillus pseudoviridinutans TaxID=1517512 RepID=A0A9P3BPN4_9EURO|nr:uncharacterized protein Asppvi_001976 [Aspergillus pseudoviridinutans]GIJ92698.1 hypothetical protein Asppvi_001976 [Aspergillus pseudoviridinutans]